MWRRGKRHTHRSAPFQSRTLRQDKNELAADRPGVRRHLRALARPGLPGFVDLRVPALPEGCLTKEPRLRGPTASYAETFSCLPPPTKIVDSQKAKGGGFTGGLHSTENERSGVASGLSQEGRPTTNSAGARSEGSEQETTGKKGRGTCGA